MRLSHDLPKFIITNKLLQRYYVQEYLRPFLLEQMIPLRPILGSEQEDYPTNNFPPDYESLLGNSYFQNLVDMKKLYASNVLEELAIVRKECEKIILITEQELEKQNWSEDKIH